MSALILFLPFNVKTILRVVGTRCWPYLGFSHSSLINNITTWLWNENIFSTSLVGFNWLGIVLAHSGCLLFEINIDCDRFNVVKWVIFVKRQTEIALVVHVRSRKMLLRLFWVVLSGPYLNFRVWLEHISCRDESLSFAVELFLNKWAIKVPKLCHFWI